jgi:Tol biopolymer transport system component
VKRFVSAVVCGALVAMVHAVPGAVATQFPAPVDGKIAVVGTLDGHPQVYVVNPDGTGLSAIPGAWDWPMFSSDGSHLAFTGTVGSQYGLFIADADGGSPRLVSASGYGFPAWSADGSHFAYARGQDIFTMAADGSDVRNLTNNDPTSTGIDFFPAWSPDGTQIVFVRTGSAGAGPGIYLMHADGTGQTRIVNDGWVNQAPVFSHAGTRIAFDAVINGDGHIFTVNADGTGLSDAATAPAGLAPVWSVDDSRFLFLSLGANHLPTHAGLMNVDGSNIRTLDGVPASDDPLSWQVLASPQASAPRGVAAAAGNGFATATWTPPLYDGATPILAYGVTTSHNGVPVSWQAVAGDVHSVSIPGLTDATAYDVVVTAFNRNGFGAPSAAVSVTPSAGGASPVAPPAPTNLLVIPGNGYATASWSPPTSDGGAPIVAYSVVATDNATNAKTWTTVAADVRAASTPRLVDGHTYAVSVLAWNARGASVAAPSPSVSPTSTSPAAGVPGPVGYQSVSGGSSLSLNWSPAPDNGAPITGYSVVVLQAGKVVAWVNRASNDRSGRVDHVAAGVPTTVYVLPSNRVGFTSTATPMTLSP